MKITKSFLESKGACPEGIMYVTDNNYLGLPKKLFLNKLITEDKLDYANWLIVRVMQYKQYVSYAIFAAEQVINIYEIAYPDNDKPRKAIESAKICFTNPTKKNANAAYAANFAAAAAAYFAANFAANSAANAAANAAAAAAANTAAAAAANSAYAVAYAVYAVYAVANSANAANAKKEMKLKILNYGMSLIN